MFVYLKQSLEKHFCTNISYKQLKTVASCLWHYVWLTSQSFEPQTFRFRNEHAIKLSDKVLVFQKLND